MGTAEVLLPMEDLSYFLIPMAKKAKVPVVIHFDHGLTKEACLKALDLGFSSIMYDCSTDSYEENIEKVREMADIAHSYIHCGISKVNIFTDINIAAVEAEFRVVRGTGLW